MVEKTRTVLLDVHARWPSSILVELWPFAFLHVINQWKNTPRFDLAYLTPDGKSNGLKHQNRPADYFKIFDSFGCPVYVLNEKQ